MSLTPDEALQKIIVFLRQQQTTLLLDENIDIPGTKEHFFLSQELLQYLVSEIFDINPETVSENGYLSVLFRETQTRKIDDLIIELFKRVKMSPLYIDEDVVTDNYSEQIYNLYHNSQSYMLGNDVCPQDENQQNQFENHSIDSQHLAQSNFQKKRMTEEEYFHEHPAVSLSPSETPGLLLQSTVSKGQNGSPTGQQNQQQNTSLDTVSEEGHSEQQKTTANPQNGPLKPNMSAESLATLSSMNTDLEVQLINAIPALVSVGNSFSSTEPHGDDGGQNDNKEHTSPSADLRRNASQDVNLEEDQSVSQAEKQTKGAKIPPKQPQTQKSQPETTQQSGLNIQQIIHELAAYKEFKYKLEQHLNIKIDDISGYDVTNLKLATLESQNSELTSDNGFVQNHKRNEGNTSLCLYNNESFDYRKIESGPSMAGNESAMGDGGNNVSMNKEDRSQDDTQNNQKNPNSPQHEIPQSLQLEGTLKSPEVLQLELKVQQQQKQIDLYNNQLKWIFSYLDDIGTEFRIDSVSKVHGLHQKLSGLQNFLKKREAEWLQQEAGQYQQILISKYQKLVGQLRQQVTTLHMKLQTLQNNNVSLIREQNSTKQQLRNLQHSNFGLQKRVKSIPGENIFSVIDKQKNTARVLMQQVDAMKKK